MIISLFVFYNKERDTSIASRIMSNSMRNQEAMETASLVMCNYKKQLDFGKTKQQLKNQLRVFL